MFVPSVTFKIEVHPPGSVTVIPVPPVVTTNINS